MTKRSLKDAKRKQEKAKTKQNYCRKKNVKEDCKQGDEDKDKQKFITQRTGLKRKLTLLSDEEKYPDDYAERESNKKRKKGRREREVNTSEMSDSVEDKHQHERKEKEIRGESLQLKLTETANSFYSGCEERNSKSKNYTDSGKKKKESGEHNRDEKEHSKHKHDKKEKEPKVEKRKYEKNVCEVQQGVNQKDDLQNISDVQNVGNEVDDKNKKKKRKKVKSENTLNIESNRKFGDDILGTNEDEDSEKTDAVKKKKKKKSKPQAGQESKTTIHPGVDYLHTWYNDRVNWNFKKVRQVWLLHNMFDQEQISDEDFHILLKYLEGLKGTAKDRTIEMAEQRLENGTGASEQDAVIESRVRQVLQLLTE